MAKRRKAFRRAALLLSAAIWMRRQIFIAMSIARMIQRIILRATIIICSLSLSGKAENGVFKGAGGESECVFNKKTVSNAYIYEGSGFTAFRDGLSDGNVIWFFLPDDGKTVSDVIKTDLVSYVNGSCDGKRYDVTVRMPDFDVNFNSSIKETMKDLGITYCMEPGKADFSSLSDDDLYVSSAVHAARFKADKEGVEGAAYTVIMAEATGEPVDLPDYDLTLDRPFAFMVENNGVPLFTGCVCGLD